MECCCLLLEVFEQSHLKMKQNISAGQGQELATSAAGIEKCWTGPRASYKCSLHREVLDGAKS